jgi:hypothetical protein
MRRTAGWLTATTTPPTTATTTSASAWFSPQLKRKDGFPLLNRILSHPPKRVNGKRMNYGKVTLKYFISFISTP